MHKRSVVRRVSPAALSTVLAICALLVAAAPVLAKPPAPASRIYFVVVVGFDDDYSVGATCLKFSETEFWDVLEPSTRGTWQYTETDGTTTGVSIEAEFLEDVDGLPVTIYLEGQGRTDASGKMSSIGGAGNLEVPLAGLTANFGLTGREAKKAKCKRLARELNRALGSDD